MENKNRGINWSKELAERSDKDYKHLKGVSPISIFVIPKDLREKYLSKGERQNIGEEKMDCVSRAVCNNEENELNYAYDNNLLTDENRDFLETNGYIQDKRVVLSDVWVGLGSGTTKEGNSLKAPIDFARKNGMLPKKLLPQLESWDDNYNPARITEEMKRLANEFKERFPIGYEQVSELQFSMNDDGMVVALYAWTPPVNGVYQRNDFDPNHSVYKFTKIVNHKIEDNYEENPDDFIKELAPDFNFMDYGYRLYFISQKDEPKIEVTHVKKNFFFGLVGTFKRLWRQLFDKGSLGAARASGWIIFRKLHIKDYCELCEVKGSFLRPLELHHIRRFVDNPELELDPNNVITACRHCHLRYCHLGSFHSYCLEIKELANEWQERRRDRP